MSKSHRQAHQSARGQAIVGGQAAESMKGGIAMNQHSYRRFFLCVLVLAVLFGFNTTVSSQTTEKETAVEEAILREAKVDNTDAGLLAFLRRRTSAMTDDLDTEGLIRKLGSPEFEDREAASARLIALGRGALDALRKAGKSEDPEVANRAQACLEMITVHENLEVSLVVVRSVLKRQPSEGVAVLVGYLPFAPNEAVSDAIYFGLDAWSQQTGKLHPAVLKAVKDTQQARRALAGCLVGRWGDVSQQAAVVGLLEDRHAIVRLRAAQGLLAGEKMDGLPTLIALLQEPELDIAWQAEELLHYVAGDESPAAVLGHGSEAERKKCQEGWEKWWQAKGNSLDLAGVRRGVRRPGLVLAIEEVSPPPPKSFEEMFNNGGPWVARVWLCGCDGQPRCEPYRFDQFKTMLKPRIHPRMLIATGGDVGAAYHFEQLGLWERKELVIQGMRKKKWPNDGTKEKFRPPFVAMVGNGNRLEAKGGMRNPKRIHRLVELDSAGRIVWESGYKETVGGILMWPLVRLGFSRKGNETINLADEKNRIAMLRHRDPIVRQMAAESLVPYDSTDSLQSSEALVVAATQLLQNEDMPIRSYALTILMRGGEKAKIALPQLIKLLDHPIESDNYPLIRSTLANFKREAIPALYAAVTEHAEVKTAERRANAIFYLIRVSSAQELSTPKVREAVKMALTDQTAGIRGAAVDGFMDQGNKAMAFLPDLITLLKDSDKSIVRSVLFNLQDLGDSGDSAIPEVMKLLRDSKMRGWAISTLGTIGRKHPSVYAALYDLATPTQDVDVCGSVADTLSRYKEGPEIDRIIPVLIRMLNDSRKGNGNRNDKPVQRAAIQALRVLGKHAKAAGPALRIIVLEDPKFGIQAQDALELLTRIDPGMAAELGEIVSERIKSQSGRTGSKR
jgi:HEAT repeat protein